MWCSVLCSSRIETEDHHCARLHTCSAPRERGEVQAVFKQGPLGMTIADLAGRFREVNPAPSRVLGYAAEDLTGPSYLDMTRNNPHVRVAPQPPERSRTCNSDGPRAEDERTESNERRSCRARRYVRGDQALSTVLRSKKRPVKVSTTLQPKMIFDQRTGPSGAA
jgi:PAS domain S-box-containing protein